MTAIEHKRSCMLLESEFVEETALARKRLEDVVAAAGVQRNARAETTDSSAIDKERQRFLSKYVRATRVPLPKLVELVRGQSIRDYRPNKALKLSSITAACESYRHLDRVIRIAQEGVRVPLSRPIHRFSRRLDNHGSARERLNVLRRNVRKEQDADRVIIVDMDLLDLWPEVIVSPYGVVDKAGAGPATTGRTIRNLSFPAGNSVNDVTDKDSKPPPEYMPVEAIAREVVRLRNLHPGKTTYLLAGDVTLSFRRIHLHSDSVYLFGAVIPEDNALAIDLACPFGWTGSPSFYELFGAAISYAHARNAVAPDFEGFFIYHWVNDIAVGDTSLRATCERPLRSSMVFVLGPRAINEDKFSGWLPRLKLLGLFFNTETMTVSMPASKIEKTRLLMAASYYAVFLPPTDFRSLLGSLRHVATCIRAARPSLQRLRRAESGLQFRRTVPVTEAMRLDLAWWWSILHSTRLNGVALDYFRSLPDPDVAIFIDTCDVALCALDPARKRYLLYQFSPAEAQLIAAFKTDRTNGFDINYRELLSSTFAIWAWGALWQSTNLDTVHVHFKIDNVSVAGRLPRYCVSLRRRSFP